MTTMYSNLVRVYSIDDAPVVRCAATGVLYYRFYMGVSYNSIMNGKIYEDQRIWIWNMVSNFLSEGFLDNKVVAVKHKGDFRTLLYMLQPVNSKYRNPLN